MYIDTLIRRGRLSDKVSLPSWLTESDETFISIARLIKNAWNDGYVNELDVWGLSILPHGRIALGPLSEQKGATGFVSAIEILEEAKRKFPKRNPLRLFAQIQRSHEKGRYNFFVIQPNTRRCWENWCHPVT